MGSEALSSWLSIDYLAWSLLRISIVWLALHGTGKLILMIRAIRNPFRLMPSIIAGMLFYIALSAILSVSGFLTRQILSVFVISGALTGLLFLYIRIRMNFPRFRISKKHTLLILPMILAVFILLTNFMKAGRPDLFQDDTHVTYMVQPDRWLNQGHISFLEETKFSGFPLTVEMLMMLPSSLSDNRVDQLILCQMLQMSMLLALALMGWHIMNPGWKWIPAILISIAGCQILIEWASLAKPDITALFFVTTALLLLLKQIYNDEKQFDLSAFLIMGLALTSKQTAYLSLVPFTAMVLYIVRRDNWNIRRIISGLASVIILPLIFAIRTLLHTGSPFYPFMPVRFMLRPEWVPPDISLTFLKANDRSSDIFQQFGFLQNIWHYFRSWGSSILLLITGFLLVIRSRKFKPAVIIISATAVYSALCIAVFYPAWWGAKYGIMLIPFSAIFGIWLLRSIKHSLLPVTLSVILIFAFLESPISPVENIGFHFRAELLSSYLTGNWESEEYKLVNPDPYMPAILWMNSHLPEESRVLSLFARKRYFSNHEFIVLHRHPVSARLYLDNSLSEELEILRELEIDYVFGRQNDPIPLHDENLLEILSRTGPGDILDPIANINGYVIYGFLPDRL